MLKPTTEGVNSLTVGERRCNNSLKKWILLIFRETRGGWGTVYTFLTTSPQYQHVCKVTLKSAHVLRQTSLNRQTSEIRGQTDAGIGNKGLPSLACSRTNTKIGCALTCTGEMSCNQHAWAVGVAGGRSWHPAGELRKDSYLWRQH